MPNLWNRIQAYVNSRLPKGALASKDIASISDGGTNATNAKDARVNLGITYGTEVPTETPKTGSGTVYFFEEGYEPVPVIDGGTGANTAEGARNNLGLTDSGWIFATGQLGSPVKYRKKNGWVYIFVTSATTADIPANTFTTVFTLPEGFRPSGTNGSVRLASDAAGGTRYTTAIVNEDGNVQIHHTATSKYFNIMGSFPVDD